jgi:hypothetical protein
LVSFTFTSGGIKLKRGGFPVLKMDSGTRQISRDGGRISVHSTEHSFPFPGTTNVLGLFSNNRGYSLSLRVLFFKHIKATSFDIWRNYEENAAGLGGSEKGWKKKMGRDKR